METVILMTPNRMTMDVILEKLGSLPSEQVKRTTNDQIVVTLPAGDSRAYIDWKGEDWAQKEFHTHEEERRFRSIVPDPRMYLIDYSDIKAVKYVLRALADDPEVLVDNGFGVALPGPYFLRLMAREPEWDWRLDGRQDLPDWDELNVAKKPPEQ